MSSSKKSYPAGSRFRNALPSNKESSYSEASCVTPDVIRGSLDVAMLKPYRGVVFVCVRGFLPICCDILAMGTVLSSLPCACA